MRIVDIRERSVAISRHRDPSLPSGGLTTSMVAVVTDVMRGGKPVVGWGFASIGRFAQSGLIRERFAPRLLAAADLADPSGRTLDPFRAQTIMMAGEKPGGHGERPVAVGTLDMALWDAAAKIVDMPLWRFLADRLGRRVDTAPRIPAYASGGYYYPVDDLFRLGEEVRRLRALGYRRVKIKIGSADLTEDLRRIESAAGILAGAGNLAVDAIYAYRRDAALAAAAELQRFGLWWFEDICDPLDFDTLAAVAARYAPAIAAGEALFSAAEARLLDRHGGLRHERDILLFDPVHCYGIPGYLEIIAALEASGWPRGAFWPHGGHLFALHLAAALGLGGVEVNPLCFQPFGGYGDAMRIEDGFATPPELPGIGFEGRDALARAFRSLLDS
jgi:D(-)-tartrate dehydratase